MAANERKNTSPLRLLCFDGGGVRGLSSLYIIKQLMEAVNKQHPPKPCHFFHMIGGTSTGGIIAIMLGRLEMSVDDCITAYSTMMDSVFTKRQHRVNMRGGIQARFDTAELERCIKTIVQRYSLGNNENALMRDREVACKVFACAIPELVVTEVVKFSTYTRDFEADSDLFDNVKVWEVCRATAAASTFFDPIKLGPHGVPFLDGATAANNPIKELWTEAEKAFGENFESRVQCVVSIGTGESGHVSWGKSAIGIAKALKEMATYTENAWRSFKADHRDLKNADRLYRFNVVRGLEKVGLEDAKSRATIQQMTTFYMGSEDMFDTLKRFKRISDTWHEGPDPVEARPVQPPPPRTVFSQGFLVLGRDAKWVNAQSLEPSYWSRLTYNGLVVYEGVYKAMKREETAEVTFEQFERYFASLNTPNSRLKNSNLVRQVWSRLPMESNTANKALVLAAVYMVHMEAIVDPNFLPHFDPINPSQFTNLRKRFLGCYSNWVRCACSCGRLWSFANGVEGLQLDRWKNCNKKCKAVVLPMNQGNSGLFSKIFRRSSEKENSEAVRLFNKNRVAWLAPQPDGNRIQLSTTF